jgi:DNA adenine methylase
MTVRAQRLTLPRPFLKWVGGKGQLLPELLKRIDAAGDFGRYHEPFVGGGALFFELVRTNRLPRAKAYLSDNNARLVETYAAVQTDVERLITLLQKHKAKHSEAYFYEVRAKVPRDPIARAARIIFLNKTCYNGLYRENRRGEFNAPFGRYKNPGICDEDNLKAVATALKRAKLTCQHFEEAAKRAEPGDLVYFDPPYHPVSKTSSFTGYDASGFNEDSQRLLANVLAVLDGRGVKVLLSNSMTPLIEELYAGFTIDEVQARRNVNSRADRRGPIAEALIRNF